MHYLLRVIKIFVVRALNCCNTIQLTSNGGIKKYRKSNLGLYDFKGQIRDDRQVFKHQSHSIHLFFKKGSGWRVSYYSKVSFLDIL